MKKFLISFVCVIFLLNISFLKGQEISVPKITLEKVKYDKLYKYAKAFLQMKDIEDQNKVIFYTKKAYRENEKNYVIPVKMVWVNSDKVIIKELIIMVKFPITDIGFSI